ncbi:O-antigen polysaccharide polymerase Wzy family protein [Actinomyces bowdenii]|uniref:O-antigen polysaccharide polymerase Wzy n=1 Tax=Actinomyces bowdenii TaxID=131109 RepID=A0A3P1V7W3_9ACTO|nr:O-antigen polysaccharide polymerase Wzy family protein [Actinomyces bowdenii]RRD29757.1 O-antigen polysaccharide polymerase Wzy [Actinomyces bowdenii]
MSAVPAALAGRPARGRRRPSRATGRWEDRRRRAVPRQQRALPVILSNLILLVLVLWSECDWPWALLVAVWLNLFLYCVLTRSRPVFLGGYLISFFILLLSQATLERIFGYDSGRTDPAAHPTTVGILYVGLISSTLGYMLSGLLALPYRAALTRLRGLLGRGGGPRRVRLRRSPGAHTGLEHLRQACLIVVLLTFPLSSFWLISTIARTGISGYLSLYTTEYISQNSGIVHLLGTYSSDICFVAYLILLATMPSQRQLILPTAALTLIKGLYLLMGVRKEFTVFAIVMVCYVILRNKLDPDQGWVTRRRASAIGLGTAALAFLLTAMESVRGQGSSASLLEFLYNQGVSVRVIDNIVLYGHRLPDQFYLAYFAHYGLVGRLLGYPPLQGNSLERAEAGGSLSHSLSRIALGENAYRSGMGTGTSFLAEGYLQYGMLGVILVAAVVGALLRYVDALTTASWSNCLRMLIVPSLIWIPRGPASDFIGILVEPTTIMAFMAIAALMAVSYGAQILTRPRDPADPHRAALPGRSPGAPPAR